MNNTHRYHKDKLLGPYGLIVSSQDGTTAPIHEEAGCRVDIAELAGYKPMDIGTICRRTDDLSVRNSEIHSLPSILSLDWAPHALGSLGINPSGTGSTGSQVCGNFQR